MKVKKDGFTLIELLVVTSLAVLLLLTITTLFMTFLVSNSKTNVHKAIKEEGLHALSQMEFIIKNARYYTGTCAPNQNTISVVGLDGGTTTYSIENSKITSSSAGVTNAILTSSAVVAESLTFDCSGTVGNTQIKIKFTLKKVAPTLGADSNLSENFETTVNMRN